MLRLCHLLLGDRDDAHDVSQDVFVKCFRERAARAKAIAWGPWLNRVAVNACHDRSRRRRRRRDSDVLALGECDLMSESPTPEKEVLGNERRRAIRERFQRLPLRQREVFMLRYLEGWSTEETAAALHVTTGTVKRHLFRAIHRLRARLRDVS